MEEFLEIVSFFDPDVATSLLLRVASIIGSARILMKPAVSFWNSRVAPYIDIRPKDKMLKHPLYKSVTYLIDWTLSIKAPQEIKND